MKLIEQYIEFTDSELEDAEKYIRAASEAKINGRTAEMNNAIKLASEELNHALSWHDLTVACIEKKKAELMTADIAIPEYMTYMWNKEHEEYIELVGKIKYELDTLRK